MDRVIYILISLLLAFGTYHFWDRSKKINDQKVQVEQALAEEKQKSEIKINNSTFAEVTKFTFLEITNEFLYFYEDKIGVKNIKAIYEWDYTFSFGFDLSKHDGWDWRPKIIDEELGIVQITAPKIVQTNANIPSPVLKHLILKPRTKEHHKEAARKVLEYATKKMEDMANSYLSKETTTISIKKALGSHLQNVMNSTHANSNPISEVRVVFSEDENQ